MSRRNTNIGTGLASNSSRNEASRCFISVMSTRRPMMPPSLVRRSSIRMQRPSASHCSWRPRRVVEQREALGEPFLLAALGGGIVAAHDADAQRVLEPRADLEQVGAALVDVGVLLVPQDVAAFRVEEDDALRQDLDGLAQPLVRRLGGRDGGIGFRARGFQLGAAVCESGEPRRKAPHHVRTNSFLAALRVTRATSFRHCCRDPTCARPVSARLSKPRTSNKYCCDRSGTRRSSARPLVEQSARCRTSIFRHVMATAQRPVICPHADRGCPKFGQLPPCLRISCRNLYELSAART